MDILNEMIITLRIVIITIGIIARVMFCLIRMIYDEEAQISYKKKIVNTIVFGILSELIFVLKDLIEKYYN